MAALSKKDVDQKRTTSLQRIVEDALEANIPARVGVVTGAEIDLVDFDIVGMRIDGKDLVVQLADGKDVTLVNFLVAGNGAVLSLGGGIFSELVEFSSAQINVAADVVGRGSATGGEHAVTSIYLLHGAKGGALESSEESLPPENVFELLFPDESDVSAGHGRGHAEKHTHARGHDHDDDDIYDDLVEADGESESDGQSVHNNLSGPKKPDSQDNQDDQGEDDDHGERANEAPAALTLENATTTLGENVKIGLGLKVADITITDDGRGLNNITLTGEDADLFEVVGTELRLKAGVVLDYKTNARLDVTVEIDDPAVGLNPDLTQNFSIRVSGANEAPTALVLTNTTTSLSEGVDTSGAIKVADIGITDDALGINTISLTGADATLFEVVGTELRFKIPAGIGTKRTDQQIRITVPVYITGIRNGYTALIICSYTV